MSRYRLCNLHAAGANFFWAHLGVLQIPSNPSFQAVYETEGHSPSSSPAKSRRLIDP